MAKILCDPSIRSGKPLISGTDVTVEEILVKLSSGEPLDELMATYPELNGQAVQAALDFAVIALQHYASKQHGTVELSSEQQEFIRRYSDQVNELGEIRRLKNRYFSFIVHELKRPLTAVLGASDFLTTRGLDIPDSKAMMEIIHRSALVMKEMIENILKLEQMKPLEELDDFTSVSVRKIVETVSRDFEVALQNKGISLNITIDPGLTVPADREKLTAVFSNLLSNSVKFTASGSIIVAARPDAGGVHFLVMDTGRGMSTSEQAYVHRVLSKPGDVKKRSDGSGIGLRIVREFISLHGGKIWFESVPGNGAIFHFTLPNRPVRVSKNDRAASVHFAGTRIGSHATLLKQTILDLIDEGINDIILDISRVEAVNSLEIGVMFGLYRALHEANGTLSLRKTSWQVMEVLRLTQLDRLITILPVKK